MSAADFLGCLGLALLILLIIASIPWPSYDDQDFAHPQDRRDATRQLNSHSTKGAR